MPGTHPAGFVERTAGDEVVNVRVIPQIPRPGLQDARHPQLPAQVPRVGRQIGQGTGAFAEQ